MLKYRISIKSGIMENHKGINYCRILVLSLSKFKTLTKISSTALRSQRFSTLLKIKILANSAVKKCG